MRHSACAEHDASIAGTVVVGVNDSIEPAPVGTRLSNKETEADGAEESKALGGAVSGASVGTKDSIDSVSVGVKDSIISASVGTRLSIATVAVGTNESIGSAADGDNDSIGEAAEGADDCPETKGRADKRAIEVQIFIFLRCVWCGRSILGTMAQTAMEAAMP